MLLTMGKPTMKNGVKNILPTVKTNKDRGVTMGSGLCVKRIFHIVEHADFIENKLFFDDVKFSPLKGETVFSHRHPTVVFREVRS
jgi:hypothetical protein